MNLNQARVGAYLAPTAALWSGLVTSYDSDTFTLVVSTGSGALTTVAAGMAISLVNTSRYVRIRSIDVGTATLVLAENPLDLTPGQALGIYNVRLPFPRYQRVTEAGVAYKDWDIAWPGQYLAMPPRCVVFPEVLVAAVGESVPITSLSSEAMSPGSSIFSYGWAPGLDGAITGSGGSVAVAYSSSGFRYLRADVVDDQGAQAYRYIPCWIGMPVTQVAEARLNWRAGGGWTADMELITNPYIIQRSPVALVDLDTNEVLFYGFIHPQSVRYDFEREALKFTALSPLAYMGQLYSYPFLVTTLGDGESDEWAEVYDLTLQRAVWYLLYWHANIAELANVLLEANDRSIQGQEFSAGTLLAQLTEVAKAAFWQPRGWRSGGFSVIMDPLYNRLFSGLSTLLLAAADIAGEIAYDRPMNWISEARLTGVYYDGGWVPLIVRAPSHPEDIGRPEEVPGLAPLDSTELHAWAARHLALAQVDEYSLTTFVDVNPRDILCLELPDGTVTAPESISLDHDAEGLRWTERVTGRGYGIDVTTVTEPAPPEIVVPPPVLPPLIPPIPPIPVESWADGNTVVLVANNGNDGYRGAIFRTFNFTDPSPTWENITPASWTFVTSLLTEPVFMIGVTINQLTRSVWVTIRGTNNRYCVIRSKDALLTAGTPTWALVPFQTATTPPVTYTANPTRHPRVLFDDTLAVGGYVALRMVKGDAAGAIVDDNEQHMVLLDDDFAVQSLTCIGSSAGWVEAPMVEFNDTLSGFLSYHTWSDGGWQIRRLNAPFGMALADAETHCIATNLPAWLKSDPLVRVSPGYRMNGSDAVPYITYRLTEASLESGVDDRTPVLDFERIEGQCDQKNSEQPFARNIGKRPGWLAICSDDAVYPGLWLSSNYAASFTGYATSLVSLATHPALYPHGTGAYYVFMQRNYYTGSVHTGGKIYAWIVATASLSERTGNLASLVASARWSDYPTVRKPLDVLWGPE